MDSYIYEAFGMKLLFFIILIPVLTWSQEPSREKQEDVFHGFDAVKSMKEEDKKKLYEDLGNKNVDEIMEKNPELTPGQIKTMMRRK
jgi:hypothetical protein